MKTHKRTKMINLHEDAKFIYVTWIFNMSKGTRRKYL